MTASMEISSILSGLLAVAVSVVGWFLSRAVKQMDGRLEEFSVGLRELGTKMATARETDVELRVRVASIERDLDRLSQLHADTAGFLQGMGFKRRDGRETPK